MSTLSYHFSEFAIGAGNRSFRPWRSLIWTIVQL